MLKKKTNPKKKNNNQEGFDLNTIQALPKEEISIFYVSFFFRPKKKKRKSTHIGRIYEAFLSSLPWQYT